MKKEIKEKQRTHAKYASLFTQKFLENKEENSFQENRKLKTKEILK